MTVMREYINDMVSEARRGIGDPESAPMVGEILMQRILAYDALHRRIVARGLYEWMTDQTDDILSPEEICAIVESISCPEGNPHNAEVVVRSIDEWLRGPKLGPGNPKGKA